MFEIVTNLIKQYAKVLEVVVMRGNACERIRNDMKNGNNKVRKHMGVVRHSATSCDIGDLGRQVGDRSRYLVRGFFLSGDLVIA
jgi:hypothetical protein